MTHSGAPAEDRRPTPHEALVARRGDLVDLATAYRLSNVRVFGSVARGEDVSGSDLDLLVTRSPGVGLLAFAEFAEFAENAERLLGVEVDVVTDGGLRPDHEVLRTAIAL